jgi:hexulose-6-phosphate isomerase
VLTECAPLAEQAGVVFAVENVGQALAATADDLLCIVETVGSLAVQVYYDVGNAAWTGADPVRDVRLLGRHIAMVHVKDRGEVDGRPQTVVIGDGTVPFRAVGDALREIGYDDYLVLEVPGTAATADETATRSRDALRAFGL